MFMAVMQIRGVGMAVLQGSMTVFVSMFAFDHRRIVSLVCMLVMLIMYMPVMVRFNRMHMAVRVIF